MLAMVNSAPGSELLGHRNSSQDHGSVTQDQAFQVDFSREVNADTNLRPISQYESNPLFGQDASQAHTKYVIGLNKNFIARNFTKLLQFCKI
jgi:hypothetical protein